MTINYIHLHYEAENIKAAAQQLLYITEAIVKRKVLSVLQNHVRALKVRTMRMQMIQ